MRIEIKGGGEGVPQLGDVVLVTDRDKPTTPGIVCGFDKKTRHLLVTVFDRHMSRLRVPIEGLRTERNPPALVEGQSEAPK